MALCWSMYCWLGQDDRLGSACSWVAEWCPCMLWGCRIPYKSRQHQRAVSLFSYGCCAAKVQTTVEKRSIHKIDQRRLTAFSIFGCCWMGAGQYVLYCRLFEVIFPGSTPTASLCKMFLDQFVHVPFLFLPIFYATDAWVRGEGIDYVQEKYQREALTTLKANWCIWVPASFLSFFAIPTHWRIPYVSLVSFISTSIFSALQGHFRSVSASRRASPEP